MCANQETIFIHFHVIHVIKNVAMPYFIAARDSFYEVEHKLDHYPGLVVVRARMIHDNTTFYANGVGECKLSGISSF